VPIAFAQPARLTWALCLAIGTCTHVAHLFSNGWAPPALPLATSIFWDALTFLDPLAAVLLFVRPRVGLVATLAIMVADVAHNVWFIAAFGGVVWMVVAQAVFLVFVLATTRLVWRHARQIPLATPVTQG
jgi:hypothetical protein